MAKDLAMIIDYKYCTGCFGCELSCRNEKGFSLDEFGIKVVEQKPVKMEGKWLWNFLPIPSFLCDCCADRVEAGEVPPCQLQCLAKCIEVVPLEDSNKRMAELGNTVVCFRP